MPGLPCGNSTVAAPCLAMRSIRASSVSSASIALLVTVLATGIPVSAETDHDELGAHIEAGHGAHGIGLIQWDLKIERTAPLEVPVAAAPAARLDLQTPRSRAASRGSSHRPRSRAPPEQRPRAPPPST